MTQTTGSVATGNKSVNTGVSARRRIVVESEIHSGEKSKVVRFEQDLEFENLSTYVSDGLVQVRMSWASALESYGLYTQYVHSTPVDGTIYQWDIQVDP